MDSKIFISVLVLLSVVADMSVNRIPITNGRIKHIRLFGCPMNKNGKMTVKSALDDSCSPVKMILEDLTTGVG